MYIINYVINQMKKQILFTVATLVVIIWIVLWVRISLNGIVSYIDLKLFNNTYKTTQIQNSIYNERTFVWNDNFSDQIQFMLSIIHANSNMYCQGKIPNEFRHFNDLELIDIFETDQYEYVGACYGNDKLVVFVFRSSNTVRNWFDNIWGARQLTEFVPNSTSKVHSGFMRNYQSIRTQVQKRLHTYVDSKCEIVFSGHSLGGALSLCAMMDAFLIKQIDKTRLSAYTFGCPKVGNKEFAMNFSKSKVYRISNTEDIVPQLPVWPILLWHVGTPILFCLNTGALHTNHNYNNSFDIFSSKNVKNDIEK